jgi:hypothetical protein
MFPVIDAALRYFVHIFFVPFIFLGLATEKINRKFPNKFTRSVVVIVFILIAWMNLSSVKKVIDSSFVEERVVLGQVEAMADYMIREGDSRNEMYLIHNASGSRFFKSVRYIMDRKGYSLLRNEGEEEIMIIDKSLPIFIAVSGMSEECSLGMPYKKYGEVEKCQNFYGVTIMKILSAK